MNIIEKLSDSLKNRYQNNLELMRGSDKKYHYRDKSYQ